MPRTHIYTSTHDPSPQPPPLDPKTHLKLSLLLERPDLELGPVLLEHALAVVLPELLGGVLAGHALEDLGAARVVVEEACVCAGCVG